jgi:hypothetical protein
LQLKLSSDCKASSHFQGRRKVFKKAWICAAACSSSEMPFLVVGMRRNTESQQRPLYGLQFGHYWGHFCSLNGASGNWSRSWSALLLSNVFVFLFWVPANFHTAATKYRNPLRIEQRVFFFLGEQLHKSLLLKTSFPEVRSRLFETMSFL